MKCDLKHYGLIKNGKKTYFNPELYYGQLRQLEGKEFCEVISEVKKRPSTNLNNYYRGGILPTCYQSEKFSWMDNKDQIHDDYFAPKFLSYVKLIMIDGKPKEITMIRSWAELSMKEATEFVEKVIADCEMDGIHIMEPSEYYNKYYR